MIVDTHTGGPGRNGGPAGDLLVELTVTPHPLFGRTGDNLTVAVPVTFAEAALGADIDVPTLDGSRVTLRIKAGTQSGSRHRVKGKGVQTKHRTGDLIVTVLVDVPTELTDDTGEFLAKRGNEFGSVTGRRRRTVRARSRGGGRPGAGALRDNPLAEADRYSEDQ